MITFTIPMVVEWSEDHLEDHLLGAGAATFSWWRTLDFKDGQYILEIDDPNDEDKTVKVHRTPGEIAQDIEKAATAVPQIARAIARDDIDAVDADALLQYIVLGEVVYG